ncbi:MAG TPA: nucleotidyltransferase family protein [Rhizomicrobium sp.]|nr:nucleotidyltransferase family protein [Rhizomicrobium sp.]
MQQPKAPELRLLLACARAHPSQDDKAAIRQLLNEGTDWTLFVQKAVSHGLAGLAGHTLGLAAPDMVPEDILAAFQAYVEQTRASNQVLLDELAELIEKLDDAGVDTIPFKGPVLTFQAFGDLGLRGFSDLDFLIRDGDVAQAIKTLLGFGYVRPANLTETQFRLIHRLQGQEIMFKQDMGAIEPHTRLTPIKMALDIDYDGLWRRARRESIFGRTMQTLSPEDTFVVLAIHGGKELWWDIKWACDVSDFIASHPLMDWNTVDARARAQGCHRMLLVATSLARNYLGAKIPDFIMAAEAADPAIEGIVGRIIARWEAGDPGGPPSNKTLSMDRLRLHDGVIRKAGYVMRTVFLPGPEHIAMVALPRSLGFAYIPIGLAHDLVALPLYRVYERLAARAERLVAISPIALALAPVSGETRKAMKRRQLEYRKAAREAAAAPENHLARVAMGDARAAMKLYQDAIACYDQALALMPDQGSIWQKRRNAIAALKQNGNFPDLKEDPEFDDKNANGWAVYAGFLSFCERNAEAAEASDRALSLDPKHDAAARIGVYSRIFTCDWSKRETDKRLVKQELASGKVVLRPFHFKLISDSEPDCLTVTDIWTKRSPEAGRPLWDGNRYQHDKIRVAYLSTDFRYHPVGSAIIAPLEHHDKNRFEITAISLISKNDPMRQRFKAAANRFVDAHAMDDRAVAKLMHDLEIDIAVDLNGLTGSRRTGILMRRSAPLQVNYLGYPGTMAAPFMDYIIADPILIPEENRAFYSEKIAYLPHTYLPYDPTRRIGERPPGREQEGLPENGLVFACFNRLYKVSPEIFDIWMRLLRALEGSVVWMPSGDAAAMAGLRREAAARGVAPERVVFAEYLEQGGDHLARLRLADLFLDTLPYNAHSTAADALWAGVPVLTCRGHSFQARVAASLLHAAGLPELVTTSLADYEERAFALARDPQQLAAIRQKLARNRETTPLFDAARFTRGLETVYRTMWERQRAGLSPETFSVAGRP